MRKTRVQNDEFWDHLNDNVDDYVQRKASVVAAFASGELSPTAVMNDTEREDQGKMMLKERKHQHSKSRLERKNVQKLKKPQVKSRQIQMSTLNEENMLVTLGSLERTIPKNKKKSALSKGKIK